MEAYSKYKTERFLREHILETFGFYHPRCIDTNGGFYHHYKDDGSLYARGTRHLVSSARFVFNYAMAAVEFENPEYRDFIRHGLKFIEDVHFNPQSGGYAWLLDGEKVVDDTNHCYGLAFVLLAYAVAVKAGLQEARGGMDRIWELLEKHYWEPDFELYLDEINGDFTAASPYRGQNANMHMCEAMLISYEATEQSKYLDRAYALARRIVLDLTNTTEGFIWEHYTGDWEIDWDYNRVDPKHLYRPWGFLTGHQTEWSKLLLILHRHRPEEWIIDRARLLFDKSLEIGWDKSNGGILYTFAPDGTISDSDKYYWVHAESFAAAALLAMHTGDEGYWSWYDRIWQFSEEYMIDRKYGAWYRVLTGDNRPYSDEKSPAGKSDYHSMGACYEVLRGLRLSES